MTEGAARDSKGSGGRSWPCSSIAAAQLTRVKPLWNNFIKTASSYARWLATRALNGIFYIYYIYMICELARPLGWMYWRQRARCEDWLTPVWISPAVTDRQGVSEAFWSLPSSGAGYSRPVLDRMALRSLRPSLHYSHLGLRMASNACIIWDVWDWPWTSMGTKKAKSSKAPCLEPREGKISLKGSGFLVLSPNLPKACGVEPPDPACVW